MTPMVTEENRNSFILKALLDGVVEKLVICSQIKLSKPIFQHVTANETVSAIPAMKLIFSIPTTLLITSPLALVSGHV
jgi:hypothetical protein